MSNPPTSPRVRDLELGEPIQFHIHTPAGSVGPIIGEVIGIVAGDEYILMDDHGNRYLVPTGWIKRRQEQPAALAHALQRPHDALVDSLEVAKLLGVRFSDLAGWTRQGWFPEPAVRGGGRGRRNQYRLGDVLDWLGTEAATRLVQGKPRRGAA